MNDVARDSALAIVARTPGVKDVVNDVKVLPASIFDDSICAFARRARFIATRCSAVMRPIRCIPIRIVVDNGHVTLYGTVQSTMDKNIAGMRAGSVPGAFSVENKLVVN